MSAANVVSASEIVNQSEVSVLNLAAHRATIAYGSLIFPPGTTTRLRSEAVLDEGGIYVEYERITLSITAVWTGANYVPSADGGVSNESIAAIGMGRAADRIRHWLNKPRLRLIAVGKAVGDYWIEPEQVNTNTPPGIDFSSLFPNQSNPATLDVDNGPKPEPVNIIAIGDNAIITEWSVTFCVPPCGTGGPAKVDSKLVPVSYSVQDTQEGTVFRRIITGRLRLNYSNFKDKDKGKAERPLNYKSELQKWFPYRRGLIRNYDRLEETSDHKYLLFTITDSELATPDPYENGMVTMDLNYSVSSSLGGKAFTEWDCHLSGTVEVAHHVPKHMGYIAIARIYLALTDPGRSAYQVTYWEGSNDPYNPRRVEKKETIQPLTILQRIQVNEHRNTRKVSVDFEWTLVGASLSNFLQASGCLMVTYSRYAKDKTLRTTWQAWEQSITPPNIYETISPGQYPIKGTFFPPAGGVMHAPVDVAQRNPNATSVCQVFAKDDWRTKNENPIFPNVADLKPADLNYDRDQPFVPTPNPPPGTNSAPPAIPATSAAVIDLDHRIETIEEHQTDVFPLLDGQVDDYEIESLASNTVMGSTSPNAYLNGVGLPSLPGLTNADQTASINRSGPPTVQIRSYGTVVSYDRPPAKPVMRDLSGALLACVGKARYNEKTHVVRDVTGRLRSVFVLEWDKRYQLPVGPASSQEVRLASNYPVMTTSNLA